MAGQWAVAIAAYSDSDNANTLTLAPGDKLFDVSCDESDPAWSFGTLGEEVGYFPTSHVQLTSDRPNGKTVVAHTPGAGTPAQANYSSHAVAPAAAPTLPQNWSQKMSSSNQTYYVNTLSNETQWDFPTSPALPPAQRKQSEPATALPNGWVRRASTKSGRLYFFNELDGSTQWTHPALPAPLEKANTLSSVVEVRSTPAPERAPSNAASTLSNSPPPSPSKTTPAAAAAPSSAQLETAYCLITERVLLQKKLDSESKYVPRYLTVREDLSEFTWAKPTSKLGVCKGVPFDSIIEVRCGLPSKVAKKVGSEKTCFSVVHRQGVIDCCFDKGTVNELFGSGSVEGKCKEYAEALRLIVTAFGGFAGTSEDFVNSFAGDEEVLEQQLEEMKDLKDLKDLNLSGGEGMEEQPRERQRQSISVYAADKFTEHTRWDKYHTVKQSAREMVTWSAVVPKMPLTRLDTPSLSKAGKELFKATFGCMGDDGKGSVLPVPRISRSIVVSMAGEHQLLIDELYCQLVKQTSGNPNYESERRGWQLLACCAAQFLPEMGLCECVANHANRRRFRADGIGGLAFFVYQRVMLGERDGVGGKMNAIQLGEEDITEIESCFVAESVWGTSLEGVLRKELFTTNSRAAMPPPGVLLAQKGMVPVVLKLLTNAVMQLGGATCEGIFRLAALKDDIDYVIDEIKTGDYSALNMTERGARVSDPLVAADVLKSWLRGLTTPLFPTETYNKCVKIGRGGGGKDDAMRLMQGLPAANRECLEWIFRFIVDLSKSSEVTMMTLNNLCLVFSPNLLKNPSGDPMTFASNSEIEKRFVVMCCENYE